MEKNKNQNAVELGRLGGARASEAQRAAARRNLATARERRWPGKKQKNT